MTTPTDHVIATVHRMGWLADMRRWDDLVDVFTETVDVDYTALTGGESDTTDATELVAGWAEALGALDATQHLVGSVLVNLDDDATTAIATAHFQAVHVLTVDGADELWTLGGHYRFVLSSNNDGTGTSRPSR